MTYNYKSYSESMENIRERQAKKESRDTYNSRTLIEWGRGLRDKQALEESLEN